MRTASQIIMVNKKSKIKITFTKIWGAVSLESERQVHPLTFSPNFLNLSSAALKRECSMEIK